MTERRSSARSPVDILVNKYIDGYPYACRAQDISSGGMLIHRPHEPLHTMKSYAIEIGVPGQDERIWVWARVAWTRGRAQALRFMGMGDTDRVMLDQLIDEAARAA